MAAPLCNDLRLRVVSSIGSGLSRRSAAARFDVSIASAVRWYPRYQRTGSIEPAVIGGDRQSHRGKLMRRGSLAGLMSEET